MGKLYSHLMANTIALSKKNIIFAKCLIKSMRKLITLLKIERIT